MSTSEIKNWVLNIAGRKVSMTAPAAGQFLRWNQSAGSWEPQDLGSLLHDVISDWNSAVDNRIAQQKGQANGLATLGPDGRIPTAQIPALAITRVEVVGSQAEQLALSGMEAGDVVIRTDLSRTFIHNGGSTGTMSDYTELLAPQSAVISVNGQTGAVVLTTDQIAEGSGNLYFTTSRGQAIPAGGDLSGMIGSATVVKIRGISVSSTAPSDGQVLVYNETTQSWEPGIPTAVPVSHTHGIGDVSGLQAALDAKASLSYVNGELDRTVRYETFVYNYNDSGLFKDNSNEIVLLLFQAGKYFKICNITLVHTQAFVGSGISQVRVSVGARVGVEVDPEFYTSAFDISQQPGPGKFHDAALWLSKRVGEEHDIVLRFTADGPFGNGSSTVLTSGKLYVTIGYVDLYKDLSEKPVFS